MANAKRDDLKLEIRQLLNDNKKFITTINSKLNNDDFKFNLDQVDVMIDSLLKSIIKLTDEYDELMLQGFGSFKAVMREQRKGRNPSNGEEILINAKRIPKFKAGKIFNDTIERRKSNV
ncbi:HU family DNA-binding protein [Lysinibacillus sp. NPDC086135]|uniref:HU family DNA-binding protein n=1 Tax=Lysinibacillus sp. NPDC086135 TaxID=3364130 RepID=UPI0038308946